MPAGTDDAADSLRPTIRGSRVSIRPGEPDDVLPLLAIQAEESVTR